MGLGPKIEIDIKRKEEGKEEEKAVGWVEKKEKEYKRRRKGEEAVGWVGF